MSGIPIYSTLGKTKELALFGRYACEDIVEDVKVTLPGWCPSDAITFEIVIQSLNSYKSSAVRELQFGVHPKT
jgi:hypothetical protein